VHPTNHKIISVVLVTFGTYFGFQALDLISGIYQIEVYFSVAWYVFAFHLFWVLFIFDLHFKTPGHLSKAREKHKGWIVFWHALKSRAHHLYHWSYARNYLHYLILPGIIYWSVIVLMYLNPFHELFKDALIILATVAMSVVYWYFKVSFSRNMELHETGLKVLALAKLFAAYLAFTAILALGWYHALSTNLLFISTFLLVFVLVYQALFQHKLLSLHALVPILMVAILTALTLVIVLQKWNLNYYTAGLMVVVVYNTAWGLLHKYLDKELTRRMVGEYLAMLLVLISIILATQNFDGRI
jgi:hypothetical protein